MSEHRHPSFEELSAWHDGELGAGAAQGVGHHVAQCARCAATVSDLSSLSAVLREPPAAVPPWAWIRERVTRPEPRRGIPRLALAASLTLALALGATWALWPRQAETLSIVPYVEGVSSGDAARMAAFLAQAGAIPEDARGRGRGAPVPASLPGGFELEACYRLGRFGSTYCAVYAKEGRELAVFQGPAGRPIRCAPETMAACMLSGLPCLTAGDRNVQVVHVDPGGRNVAVVAEAGVPLQEVLGVLAGTVPRPSAE